ncbi:hypothetical protein RJ640_017201 [Escallonia rubra]|uniref:Cathepsin propeptide inhibitor domain-containing protein n=1 Tax=Escallonia rubra TaxID=112253 RepID=A0AA88QT25_9ASTE|nr:hypothetical protein RJ640_017201 [Escallonia rubra]
MIDSKWTAAQTVRTWELFKIEFNKNYIPQSVKLKREAEFLKFEQGNLTVQQYATKFTSLARHASYLVEGEDRRARKFQDGLKPEIQEKLSILNIDDSYEMVDRALLIEKCDGDIQMKRARPLALLPPMAALLLFFLSVSASASDMSIIKFDETHDTKSSWRPDDEVMAVYESWLVEHGKSYNGLGEKEKRFQIFKDNFHFIDEQNAANRSFKLGLNRFADLTNEEYRSMYLGTKIDSIRGWRKGGRATGMLHTSAIAYRI